MIGVAFTTDATRGDGLHGVYFDLPIKQAHETRIYRVWPGQISKDMAEDSGVALAAIYDELASGVVSRFASAGFDAMPYIDVIRAAIEQVEPYS